MSSRGTVSSKRTIVLLEGENNTRSGLRDVAAYRIETAAGHLDRKETSSHSLEEESLGRQVVCAAWCGQGGVDRLTQTVPRFFLSRNGRLYGMLCGALFPEGI